MSDQDQLQSMTPGIYLETRQGTIGTGSTAKPAEYRNFWVTLAIDDGAAVMVLLDDEFRPTPIKETFKMDVVTGPGWVYVAEGQKRYELLRPHLDKMLAAPPAAAAAKPKGAAAKPAAKKGGWWDK